MTQQVDGADFLAHILSDDEPRYTTTAAQTTLWFQIPKPALQALLDKAITVVPTRDAMPVLKCVQFDVAPQRLRAIATDVQLSLIVGTTDVAVHVPGTAVFPARRLLDIVKSAEATDVTVKVTGTNAHIVIGRASWTLKMQGGADFPPMPAITEAAFVQVERTVFQSAIQAVRYAASRDPVKVNLNLIDITDGKLTASDGPRVQQIRIPDFPVTMRIPISAVDDLLRLLKMTTSETIHVGQSDTKLIFQLGGDVFVVNKIDGKFPDFEASLLRPAMENKHVLDVDRSALLAAIRRVRINTDTNSSAIALTLADNTLTVAAKDPAGNTATEAIPAGWTGPNRTIVVNHTYLTDMVNTHGSGTCAFRLGNDTKTRRTPLLLRNPDTGSVGVVQQMLVDWAPDAN